MPISKLKQLEELHEKRVVKVHEVENNDGWPEFIVGDLLIVHPGMTPINNDRILLKSKDGSAVIKNYSILDNQDLYNEMIFSGVILRSVRTYVETVSLDFPMEASLS